MTGSCAQRPHILLMFLALVANYGVGQCHRIADRRADGDGIGASHMGRIAERPAEPIGQLGGSQSPDSGLRRKAKNGQLARIRPR